MQQGGTSSKDSQAGRAALGSAAPCASYADLITVNELEVMAQDFNDASTHDDIKGVNAKINKAKQPIRELAGIVSRFTRDLVASVKDVASKSPAAHGKGKSKGKGQGCGKAGAGLAKNMATPEVVSGSTLFQIVADKGVAIATSSPPDKDALTSPALEDQHPTPSVKSVA